MAAIGASGAFAAINFENEWTVGGKTKDRGVRDMAAGKDGSLFVLEGPRPEVGPSKVTRYSPEGRVLGSWSLKSKSAGAIATDHEGNVLVTGAGRIHRFAADGGNLPAWKFGRKMKRQVWPLFLPGAAAVSDTGEVYLTNAHGRVARLSATGRYLGTFGDFDSSRGGLFLPEDIAIGSDGRVLVSQLVESYLATFGPEGKFLGQIGKKGSSPGRFLAASNLATDAQGRIAVTDALLNRVQILDSAGKYLDQVGSLGFGPSRFHDIGPVALGDGGQLYVADRGGKRVQRFTVDTEAPRLSQAQIYVRVGKNWLAAKLPGKRIALDIPVRNFGDIAATGISVCPDKSHKFTRKVFGKAPCIGPRPIAPGTTADLRMRGRIPSGERKGRIHLAKFVLKSENAGGGPFGSMIYTGRRFNWLDSYKLPREAQSVAMRLRAKGAPGN